MNLEEYIPNTQELHAIAAHMPVALSALGVLAVVVAISLKTQRGTLRWAVVGLYLLLAATAYYAKETGEDARSEVSGSIPASVWETIDRHQEMAEKVWMFALATALLMAVGSFAKQGMRLSMNLLTLVACLSAAVWVGLVGHHGGTLVYKHGVGIPPDQVVEWRLHPPAPGETPAAQAAQEEPERKLIPILPIDGATAQMVSYTRDVIPIFEEACYECHRDDDIESELDMTTVDGLLKGGEKYGTSIVPGRPDESTTIKYVRGELLPQMPEDEFPLTVDQVHTLRLWIFAGAKDDSR